MQKTKILICGGRHFNDYKTLESVIDDVLESSNLDYENVEIVSGHCVGSDQLGELFATKHNIETKIFPANWHQFGKSAGPIRNKEMISYISKFENSIVIAFVSENSKGTKNTISLAKKLGIKVIEIPYTLNESSIELFEGIRKDENGEFVIDWNLNNPTDIVKLTSTCAHLTKFNKQIRCYGYRINKLADSENRSDFLHYIKNNVQNDSEIQELIEKFIEDFYEQSPVKHFDYIAKLPSRSLINTYICNTILNNYDNCEIIDLQKEPIETLEFDWDKFKASFTGNYLDNMINCINKLIKRLKQDNQFSITKIPPKFRRYFKPMIKLGRNLVDTTSDTNILIIDDTFTTGSTINMVFSVLQNSGYKGNITVLTLISNR